MIMILFDKTPVVFVGNKQSLYLRLSIALRMFESMFECFYSSEDIYPIDAKH